ncbi:MAG: VWA domain-containing protein [Campylobacterales bacterium]
MSFLHPEMFFYLLPPLFILFGLLLTQQEIQAKFFSEEVMDKLRVSASSLSLKARNALFFLVAILIVISLSDPVIDDGEIEVKAKSSDIMIALDISDSMLAEDIYPNRLKFAKQKALNILRMNVDERIGVVAFAKNSYLVSPLSFDHSAVEFLLSKLSTHSMTEQGTDFMSLLQVVANLSKNKKHLLILSDGGDDTDFSKEIEFAKKNNIVIFILGIGTKKGSPIKLDNGEFIKQNGNIIVSKLNENISDLATKTGGVYIKSVKSNMDIKTMIKEIKDKTKAKELKSEKIKKYTPLFYYPLGLALFVLLIAMSSIPKRDIIKIMSFVMLFFIPLVDIKAGVLDFLELDKAKEAYRAKEFKKSSSLYENYARKTDNAQSYFNAGNAFYKNKEYQKAIDSYKKATFSSRDMISKKYANMGNAYAKSGTQKDLQEAVKSYEKSLKLQEDKDVRDNLEAVKKFLKKQQKKKQNKQNKKQQKENNKQRDKQNQKKKEQQQNQKKKEQKNKQQQKDAKEKQNKEKSQQKQTQKMQKSKMSDAEEKKWMKRLDMQQNSYLYKLNTKKMKKDSYEKPW